MVATSCPALPAIWKIGSCWQHNCIVSLAGCLTHTQCLRIVLQPLAALQCGLATEVASRACRMAAGGYNATGSTAASDVSQQPSNKIFHQHIGVCLARGITCASKYQHLLPLRLRQLQHPWPKPVKSHGLFEALARQMPASRWVQAASTGTLCRSSP